MRGGRTGWHSPLLLVFALLALLPAGCNLELKVAEPYLELEAQTVYNTPESVVLYYKFFADEPVLRCRYSLSKNGMEMLADETDPLASGVRYALNLNVSSFEDGLYRFRLIVQAERSKEFVDLAFLDKSVEFLVDSNAPNAPTAQEETQILSDGSYRLYLVPPEPEVKIYFTWDGTAPGPTGGTSELYNPATGIVRPPDHFADVIKAVAVDMAGNIGVLFEKNPIYRDDAPPVAPGISLGEGQRLFGPQPVTISHPEWAPIKTGTPVVVYYTLNGADPLTSGTPITQDTQINLLGDVETIVLKAVARDKSGTGNTSNLASKTYRFIRIASAVPDHSAKTACDILLTGFGFVNVSKIRFEDINFYDSNGTQAYIMYDANISGTTTIQFRVDMNDTTYGTIVANNSIPGRIDVTCHDPIGSTTTASIPFFITMN